MITAYTVVLAGLLILGGRVADIGGAARMFRVGLVVFSAASLACALAWWTAAAIALAGFVRNERRSSHPMVPGSLICTNGVLGGNLTALAGAVCAATSVTGGRRTRSTESDTSVRTARPRP